NDEGGGDRDQGVVAARAARTAPDDVLGTATSISGGYRLSRRRSRRSDADTSRGSRGCCRRRSSAAAARSFNRGKRLFNAWTSTPSAQSASASEGSTETPRRMARSSGSLLVLEDF